MEEQNLGENMVPSSSNEGTVESVDLSEVEKLQVSYEVNTFFAGRLDAPDMEEAEDRLKAFNEAQEDIDIYSALAEKYEQMKQASRDGEGIKLLAAALDFADIAKPAGINLQFNYEDFDAVKSLLKIAHNEFEKGLMSEADYDVTIKIFTRFVQFIVLMQDEPNEYYLNGLELKINHAIKTGDLTVLNF